MRTISAKFSFFKAGQGSFYGGRIWDKYTDKVFTVVYDCGTSPFIAGNNQSLNKEIDLFKHNHHCLNPFNDEIELLFISHLDYDHVSGLKRLLTEFKVKNIILPYIEKEQRKFFLTSISNNIDPDNNSTVEDYISFIESPNQFILQNSENTKMFFVKSNENTEIEYQGYGDDNQLENAYPRGTINNELDELTNQANVTKYENNLQFFIRKYWEFTTYCKCVNQNAIDNLHTCLKKILKKKQSYKLTFDDIKEIVKTKRKEVHKCYIKYIGEINSHGLILLHGPIRFEHLVGRFHSQCELNYFQNKYCYNSNFYKEQFFDNKNKNILCTLLMGDTSINPINNPINFPKALKDKFVNVHVFQVPHHGSSKNWDYKSFKSLKIGDNINRWRHQVLAVCNFGFGNTYGHPSHEVVDNLSSTMFLNSQFSRLNVIYDMIYFKL